MVRNEKGFTYPLTFCLLLLISLLLTIFLEQFIAEKRLNEQSVIILKQEYYFLSSVMNVENEIRLLEDESDESVVSGKLMFSDGQMDYKTEKLTEGLLRVMFDLRMDGLPVVSGIGYYDKDEEKMVKWIEKN